MVESRSSKITKVTALEEKLRDAFFQLDRLESMEFEELEIITFDVTTLQKMLTELDQVKDKLKES